MPDLRLPDLPGEVPNPKAPSVNPIELAHFKELARQISLGRDLHAAAREMDLPPDYVQKLGLKDGFEKVFAAERPEAFEIWKRARDTEDSDEIVQHLAKANAPRNYKALQALVDAEGLLKPEAKVTALLSLLKISGSIHEEAAVEVVKISSAHMAALAAAAKEVDGLRN